MYSTIPMSSDVEELLPGVKVFGSQVTLSPRKGPVAVNWQADWERLHEVWQGKSKAEVASEPRIAAYIKFYASIGLNPKQTPPSIQNIIQRFLIRDTMDRFPAIHPIVDAVNLAAVEYLVPLGVFDAESIEGTMSLALTEGGRRSTP